MIKSDLRDLGIDCPNKGKYIIVLCSKWCKFCTLLSPILQKYRDEGIIKLKEIDISKNGKLARKLNINVVPALLFIKDGKLLDKDLKVYGESVLNHGVLIGSFNEEILKELIKQM